MTNFESVKIFMKTFGQEIREKACFPDEKITSLRFDLINEELIPGLHKINWHAKTHASSIYFVQLRYGNLTKTQKVVFLK